MGCASIADRMVIPAFKSSKEFELIAVASRTEEKGLAYAEKFDCLAIVGYENLLTRDDIDAVYIPLPTGLHFEWAIKTLESGKHILLEKSLACTLEEAQKIVALAREKNLLVQENFMFEYHRQFSLIKNILGEGILGSLRCVRSSFGFPPFKDADNIRYQSQLGGGALLDSGAYTVKIASILTEHRPQILSASLTFDTAKEVDLFGGIMMKYPDGCVVETAFGFDHFYQCNLEIWGSQGKLTADRIFTAGPGISPKIIIETASENKIIEVEPDNHFVNLLNDFASQIHSNNFEHAYSAILLQAELLDEVKEAALKH
jgi:NDP-hexose-3-ketoreductase